MTGVKIKIECDDPLLRAAVAASIAKGLELDDFSNVAVKSIMAVHTKVYQRDLQEFGKVSLVNAVIDPDVLKQRPTYETELIPTSHAGLWPTCVECLRERASDKLATPILIDMGVEQPKYEQAERKFLTGESA
jgi:hypothetical protein